MQAAGYRRFEDVLRTLRSAHIVGLQSTATSAARFHLRDSQDVQLSKLGNFHLLHWPRRMMDGITASCGVALALRKDRFAEENIRHIFVQPRRFAGRVRGVRPT